MGLLDDTGRRLGAGGAARRGELWSAQAPVPLPQPGRVLRVLVVERDRVGSRYGLPAKRIVYVGTIDL